jgi:putative ABC transport system permease protein
MAQMIGGWTDGLIFALLAMGVYISFRIIRFSDITVDGSYTLGAAVSARLLSEGMDPFIATPVAFCVGVIAGATTGVLHTKFKINPLLSGILVMTALYSVNLRIMDKSNLPIEPSKTVAATAERLLAASGIDQRIAVFRWEVIRDNLARLLLALAIAATHGLALYAFFRTDLGTSVRATGDNDQMIRALGVNVDTMIIGALALSNGLVALSGSLYAQYQGFADLQMGIGSVVLGLASVIIGEALVGGQYHLGLAITGAIMGSILYRLVVNLVLRAGLNPNDLKLFTAIFVFVALILPDVLGRARSFVSRRLATAPKHRM